ncbi:hypothetical protein Acsp06_63460 [Actinomycetospora sp. NBRC 106375]|nr:hypothetical protein Acsp06_63460 [Actinomycetospora sp. NBRC 106375]
MEGEGGEQSALLRAVQVDHDVVVLDLQGPEKTHPRGHTVSVTRSEAKSSVRTGDSTDPVFHAV